MEPVVSILLRKKADMEAKDKKGNTPLLKAVMYNRPGVVEILLRVSRSVNGVLSHMYYIHQDGKVDPSTPNKHGRTPLVEAVSKGHVDLVSLLLRYKATVNTHKAGIPGMYQPPYSHSALH